MLYQIQVRFMYFSKTFCNFIETPMDMLRFILEKIDLSKSSIFDCNPSEFFKFDMHDLRQLFFMNKM